MTFPILVAFFAFLIVLLYLLYRLVRAMGILGGNSEKLNDRLKQIDDTLRIMSSRIGDTYEEYLSLKSENTELNNAANDELYKEAIELLKDKEVASASFFQRRMKIGYARACRILDELETAGIVGPAKGAKPREVLRNDENI